MVLEIVGDEPESSPKSEHLRWKLAERVEVIRAPPRKEAWVILVTVSTRARQGERREESKLGKSKDFRYSGKIDGIPRWEASRRSKHGRD